MTQLPAAVKVTTPPEIEQLALVVESIVKVTGQPRAGSRGRGVGRRPTVGLVGAVEVKVIVWDVLADYDRLLDLGCGAVGGVAGLVEVDHAAARVR